MNAQPTSQSSAIVATFVRLARLWRARCPAGSGAIPAPSCRAAPRLEALSWSRWVRAPETAGWRVTCRCCQMFSASRATQTTVQTKTSRRV